MSTTTTVSATTLTTDLTLGTPEKISVLTKSPINDAGLWRLRVKVVHLTYHVQIPAVEYIEWVKTNFAINKLVEYSVVNETRDGDIHHTHALLCFEEATNTRKSSIFDYDGAHPDIRIVSSKLRILNVFKYHTECGKPYVHRREIVPVVNPSFLATFLQFRAKNGTVDTLLKMDYGEEPSVHWYPWQQTVINELSEPSDPRTIGWYCDRRGNTGKTFLAKHLGMYKDSVVLNINESTDLSLISREIRIRLIQNKSISSIILTLTNSKSIDLYKLYDVIESLKDGILYASEHNDTLYFDSCHVIVLASCYPNMSLLSLDRWNLRTIEYVDRTFSVNLSGPYIRKWVEDYCISAFLDITDSSDTEIACNALISTIKDQHKIVGEQFRLRFVETYSPGVMHKI